MPAMTCPFFMPTRKSESGEWLHPSRLPLGGGWDGICMAPGHEGAIPQAEQLQNGCNLGYAAGCPQLPAQREWDAVRFVVTRERASRVCLSYVCEKNHLPGDHGLLEYSLTANQWTNCHPDPRIQKQAECFLDSWRSQRSAPLAEVSSQSAR
jgi:hypothetical protein